MNKKITAQISLLFVTIIWGLTFVMVQEALNDAPPFTFNAYRFLIAFISILLIVRNKIFNLNKLEFQGALFCGFFLFLGGNSQKIWIQKRWVNNPPFFRSSRTFRQGVFYFAT